jgi:nicotinamidase-related amidase
MDRLIPATTLLVVIDLQERLAAAMPAEPLARTVANTRILLEAAKLLGVPVLATEQYPKGLGPTLPAVAEQLNLLAVEAISKLSFDACDEPRFAQALAQHAPQAVVVVGMETHVCVFQTARQLVRLGYVTYVVSDAVCSRRDENRVAGLSLAEHAGAIVTITESVVFDWTAKAGTDVFRAVSRLVR